MATLVLIDFDEPEELPGILEAIHGQCEREGEDWGKCQTALRFAIGCLREVEPQRIASRPAPSCPVPQECWLAVSRSGAAKIERRFYLAPWEVEAATEGREHGPWVAERYLLVPWPEEGE